MAHIPGAISIPIEELEEKLAYLPSNCDVVAYCRGPYCLMSVEAVELKTTARTLRSVARKAENLMSTKVSDSTSISNQPEWLQSYLVSPEKQHQLYRKTLFIVIISQFFGGAGLAAALFTLGSAGAALFIGHLSQRFEDVLVLLLAS